MRAVLGLAGVVFAGVAAGCILVTGGADGYRALEAGSGCHTPQDCNGQVCCFTLGDGGIPSTACQATCPSWEQSCAIASDCGDGGACLTQSCTAQGTTVQVTTCGAISFCTQ